MCRQPAPLAQAPTVGAPATKAPAPRAPAAQAPATQQPAARGGSCHPAYTPCIPVKGDGSGRGDANDLDCGQVGMTVQVPGRDPYRLDADNDGQGCE